VEALEVSEPEGGGAALKEGDLPGHLRTQQEGQDPGAEGSGTDSEEGEGQESSYRQDYQLNQAVNLLRGIILRESGEAS